MPRSDAWVLFEGSSTVEKCHIRPRFSTRTPTHAAAACLKGTQHMKIGALMSAWPLYDELIDAMPSGITVHDYCLGAHWTYIVADCGMGLAKTVRGGGKGRFKQSPVDVDLKTLAALAKSWNWLEAEPGAAINACYATPDAIESFRWRNRRGRCGKRHVTNPFHRLKGAIRAVRLPSWVIFRTSMNAQSRQVTVLERNCTSPTDTPDPHANTSCLEQDYAPCS